MSKRLKIGFNTKHCSIRGTTNGCYDYARYAQSILGHECVLLWDKNQKINHPVMREMLMNSELECVEYSAPYSDGKALGQLCKDLDLDLLHVIKGGAPDGAITDVCPTVIHAVFPGTPGHRHGDVWAYSSQWLSGRHKHAYGELVDHVPRMIALPEPRDDVRKELGIPEDAVVFGRHGGRTIFDYHGAVDEILRLREDIWFVFMNTNRFGLNHERKIYLEPSACRQRKVDFIEACDAMIHAGTRGETFGIACGEFSVRNKPVFMMEKQTAWHHLSVLTGHCFRYKGYNDLVEQVLAFDPVDARTKDWSMYRKFSPEYVTGEFDRVFIKGALG